ncbi:MAG: hypothetical protein JNM81_12995 [Rhodospirillaceae bacterium]|nr:hypothetical protein [Rhodospirillaceae bacterium]
MPSEKREQPVDAQPDAMRARVVKVAADAYGATIVTLDNGQVWKQTEGTKYRVSSGAGVTISRGMLGAFFLKADNTSLAVKFKRIE